MALVVAFQMDRDVVVGKDVSVKFIQEAQIRGHTVFFFTPDKLAIKNNIPVASACLVTVEQEKLKFENVQELFLEDMDIIFIRQNPPFDMRYITSTYILEKLTKPLVINDPKFLRDYPEKLLPLLFDDFIPDTLITEDYSMLQNFYYEHKDIILKPLYSYGGNDVIRINNNVDIKVIVALMIEKYKCPIIAQQFIPNINNDKRILLLDGKPIGVFRRRILSAGEVRTNLRVGSVAEPAELSDRDYNICLAIEDKLALKGLIFAGIDVLDGYLIEINVTSPCGVLEVNKLYNVCLEKKCWDCFEEKFYARCGYV
ncbi:glutathione synthase [Ehrlichia ruminantium]|uniref:glutathione synthase n=1 Tax=Ehrlichia ruminantium TaxID=779 RepID=UPI0015DC19B5|nr:glutathione synthase [Ehrlichia ruminantium]QLK50744.1 glutathione synthase [Ehrlichia ruminantium]QLK51667.1 glutathione synthase [Ehrlichia ruminantium]QLK53505.1 glutathione synthase [Ehrlichia ruminantium]QLK59004.1 glutathione synthase [Ehrlichia ruminantium]